MNRRILVVAHNHPDFHPGGTEIFAQDLFRAYQRQGAEGLFLGATSQIHRAPHPGTYFQTIGSAADEVVIWSGHFDRFFLSQIDHHGAMQDLATLLRDFQPDVIHVHHLLLIGAEFLSLARRILPTVRIVLTLHDYYMICAHDGLMIRKTDGSRCSQANPARCHGCFPELPADRFLLRERFLKTHLQVVDCFVAPSEFLAQRFIEWGLPAESIAIIPNGRPAVPASFHRRQTGRRAVFGYFGNLNPWKGITVAIKAVRLLLDQGIEDVQLRIHGAAHFQSEAFTTELKELLDEAGPAIVHCGAYERSQLPALIEPVDWVVVPSIWWENAPLVIQEAYLHRRPVITSAVGGMAELVQEGVDGLLARPGDPLDLARVMRRAVVERSLWDRLVMQIKPPPSIDAVAQAHLLLFDRLVTAEAA